MKKKSRILGVEFWAYYMLTIPVLDQIVSCFGVHFSPIQYGILIATWIIIAVLILVKGQKQVKRYREIEVKRVMDDLEILESENQ